MNWFDVDKEGLAQVIARRGKAFVVLELLQNAWDQNVTNVDIRLEKPKGSRKVFLSVSDDDPNGFSDLTHAFTLFASSDKKTEPEKRGRFNLGEKLVLALCDEAEIRSTTGTIRFDAAGRHQSRKCTAKGTVFAASLAMTHEELDEAIALLRRVLCPDGIQTTLNGVTIPIREACACFETVLPTEIADSEGYLRRSNRKTTVRVFEPGPCEVATLYELGIPVVETGDRFSVDIQQKLPLTLERDNVSAGYLRAVRTAVLNHTFDRIDEQDATSSWVRDAVSDPRILPEAARSAFSQRFGEKAVAYDPSDREANKRAVAAGYTVVHGGHLSKEEWEGARKAGVLPPSGHVTPSAKPFSDSPDATALTCLDPSDWSDAERARVEFSKSLAARLIGVPIRVRIANDATWRFAATFGGAELILNRGVLGRAWFEGQPSDRVLELLLHEFAHHFESDHLSTGYYKALCRLGARLARAAAENPAVLRQPEFCSA